jgi:hypothetical protein
MSMARASVAGIAVRMGILPDLIGSPSRHFTVKDEARAIELLVEIVSTATSLDSNAMLLFAPDKAQMLSRPMPPLEAARVVEATAVESGSISIDPTATFLDREDLAALYLPTDGHWTAAGHRLVAELLAESIVDLGWLE